MSDANEVVDVARDTALGVLKAGGAIRAEIDKTPQGYVVKGWFECPSYPDGNYHWSRPVEDPVLVAHTLVQEASKDRAQLEGMAQLMELHPQRRVGLTTEGEQEQEESAVEDASLEARAGGGSADVADQPEAVAAEDNPSNQGPRSDTPPPTIDKTLHAEVTEDPRPEEFAGTVIQAGDPLEAWRSQRIGDVARIALAKTPAIDDDKLRELRGYVAGAAEGRWPESASVNAQLQALEADVQRSTRVRVFAEQQTKALLVGSRAFVETFDAAQGWPE